MARRRGSCLLLTLTQVERTLRQDSGAMPLRLCLTRLWWAADSVSCCVRKGTPHHELTSRYWRKGGYVQE